MSKHIADRRAVTQGGRVKHFMRLAKGERGPWHRMEAPAGNRRVVEFCRIDRGRTT